MVAPAEKGITVLLNTGVCNFVFDIRTYFTRNLPCKRGILGKLNSPLTRKRGDMLVWRDDW